MSNAFYDLPIMKRACPHIPASVGALSGQDFEQLISVRECDICRVDVARKSSSSQTMVSSGATNLWLCLYADCYMLGCSDDIQGSPDHSTKHQDTHQHHYIQLNITTRKIWCYGCVREITSDMSSRLSPKILDVSSSKIKKTSEPSPSSSQQHTFVVGSYGKPIKPKEDDSFVAKGATIDEQEMMMGDDRATTRKVGGLVGLSNLGNTCYMNAGLQCLSNIPALSDFFMTCPALIAISSSQKVSESGRNKTGVAKAYMNHVKDLWLVDNNQSTQHPYYGNRYIAPSRLMIAFKNAFPMFRGFHQHDAQEFLRCFLDQLHEELAEPLLENNEDIGYNYDNGSLTQAFAPPTATDAGDQHEELESVSEYGDGYNTPDMGKVNINDGDLHDDEAQGNEEQEYETADSGVSEQSNISSSSSREKPITENSIKPEVLDVDIVGSEQSASEDIDISCGPADTKKRKREGSLQQHSNDDSIDPTVCNSDGDASNNFIGSVSSGIGSMTTTTSYNENASDETKSNTLSSVRSQPITPSMNLGTSGDLSPSDTMSVSSRGPMKSPTKLQKRPHHSGPSVSSSSESFSNPTHLTRNPSLNVIEEPKNKPKRYRSIISDIFDGHLVSTVQCLTCDLISTTNETFQDLSLPIATQEAIQSINEANFDRLSGSQASSNAALLKRSNSLSASSSTECLLQQAHPHSSVVPNQQSEGWISWAWNWIAGWLYGPTITLNDCLSYFFSADELKGDNMYSCEKCKKLRNGLKFSRVTVLPDTLCIHLKRFRHDFAFSTKISSKVTFPLVDLDMSPWLHKDFVSQETRYDLTGVVCHHGTSGGGHYTAYALNPSNEEWYEFDDSSVTRVEPAAVLAAEAYVLFYRKNNTSNEAVRENMQALLRKDTQTPDGQSASLVQYYVSRQWINKLENFSEPGPIDNSDFLCRHGGVPPNKKAHVYNLVIALPRSVWELLNEQFGSIHCGPTSACTRLFECITCRDEEIALSRQKTYELEEFKRLHAEFQSGNNSQGPSSVHCISSSWFKQWEAFVTDRAREPPSQIDNRGIVMTVGTASATVRALKPSSDHFQVSAAIWSMWYSIYGGGPEVILRPNGSSVVIPTSYPIQLQHVQGAKTQRHGRSISESSFSSEHTSHSKPASI